MIFWLQVGNLKLQSKITTMEQIEILVEHIILMIKKLSLIKISWSTDELRISLGLSEIYNCAVEHPAPALTLSHETTDVLG